MAQWEEPQTWGGPLLPVLPLLFTSSVSHGSHLVLLYQMAPSEIFFYKV